MEFGPVRVHGLDQLDLLQPQPFIKGLFAGDGVADVEVLFVPYEALAAVAASEAFREFGLVFMDLTPMVSVPLRWLAML